MSDCPGSRLAAVAAQEWSSICALTLRCISINLIFFSSTRKASKVELDVAALLLSSEFPPEFTLALCSSDLICSLTARRFL